jgi:Tol biopolymer transport system component
VRRLAAILLLLATMAGCQGGGVGPTVFGQASPPPIPNETGVGPRSIFALASSGGLVGAGPDGTILGRIVNLPAGSMPSGVVLHPDGKRLYFAVTDIAPPPIGLGSDIYSVNVDGTDLRPLAKRDQANVFYATPTFDAKGDLFVHRREGDVSGTNVAAFMEVKDSIERIDISTGKKTTVIPDGADPTVTPAGTQIIYMKYDRGQATDLWIASTDGSKAEKFLKTDDWFSYLQSPRIAPNGREVLWSSVPPTQPKKTLTPQQGPVAARAGAGKLAHLNIPSELFIAPLDGSSIKSIFTTTDDVVPAWSSDGARIAFISKSIFWILGADGKVITKTSNIAVSYGDVVWLKSN